MHGFPSFNDIFIFSNGSKILLDDISDEGIWCTLIGQGHGKMIVRILVQLKDHRAFNFVINVNDNLDKSQFKLLDNGINSPWKVNLKTINNIISN